MLAPLGMFVVEHRFITPPIASHAPMRAIRCRGWLRMLCGYCGTLLTTMAANFNLVPTLLLGIDDPRAVGKAQVPFAIALFCFNFVAMSVLVYRF